MPKALPLKPSHGKLQANESLSIKNLLQVLRKMVEKIHDHQLLSHFVIYPDDFNFLLYNKICYI